MPSRRSPRKAATPDGEMMGASRPSKSDGASHGAPTFSPPAKAAPQSRPTTAPRRKKRDAGGVQLFAFPSPPESTAAESTADPSTPAGAASEAIPLRPKRKLKSIARYSDSDPHAKAAYPSNGGEHATYKHGEGFLCPRCGHVCSYDSRICEECNLECCYEAGVGVVTLRERRADAPEAKKQRTAGRKGVSKGDGRGETGERRGVKRGRPRGRPPKTNGRRGEHKAATHPGRTGRPRGRPPKNKGRDKHHQSPGPGTPGEKTAAGKKRARGRGVKPPPVDFDAPPSSEGWVGVGVVPLRESRRAPTTMVAADGDGDGAEPQLEGLNSTEASTPSNGEEGMGETEPRGAKKGPMAVAQDGDEAYRTSTAGSDVEKTGGEGEEGAAPEEDADDEDSHEGLVAVASTAKGAVPDESSMPGLDAGQSVATALTPEKVDVGAVPAKPPDGAKLNTDATAASKRKGETSQKRHPNNSSSDASSSDEEAAPQQPPKRAAPRSPFWKGTNPRGRPSRQVAELREKLRAATESNLALTEQVKRLQEGADAKVPGEASEADSSHRALRSTVQDCRTQIADLASSIRDKEREISSAKATHSSLQGRIASLNDDLSSARAERDRLAKPNHRSPPHHLHVPGDVSNCSTEAVEELQSKLEERAEEHARELAHVQGEKDALRAQLGDAQKKLTKRERDLAAGNERETLQRTKIARLEGMADVLMGQRDRASARVRQMLLSGSGGGSCNPLGPEASGGDGEPTATERARASFQSESEALAARLRSSLAEVAALKSQKAAAVARAAALERASEKRPEREGPAAPMGAYRDKDGGLESLSESSAGAEAPSKRNEPFAAAASLDVPSLSEAEAEADDGETKVGELTDALGSLNDFENFLQDLGLSEDEHGSRLGL